MPYTQLDGAADNGTVVVIGGVDGSGNVQKLLVGTDGSPTVNTELPAAAALADASANPTTPIIGAALMVWNGTTWDLVDGVNTGQVRITVYSATGTALAAVTPGDASIAGSTSMAAAGAHTLIYDTTSTATFVRARSNSSANMTATAQNYAAMSAQPGEWAISHVPAANTQATATKAAGTGAQRHVVRSIAFTLASTAAAAAQVVCNVIDGASGGTTYLWRGQLAITATADDESLIVLSGLNIIGTAATGMTIEFAAAGGANTLETVSATGYTTA